jgi:hypothetical protein
MLQFEQCNIAGFNRTRLLVKIFTNSFYYTKCPVYLKIWFDRYEGGFIMWESKQRQRRKRPTYFSKTKMKHLLPRVGDITYLVILILAN